MRLIAITSPDFLPGEGDRIASLLRGLFGVYTSVSPVCTAAELKALLDGIPAWCLPRLVLHDHQELALDYRLGGIHLNRRQRSLLPELRALPPSPMTRPRRSGGLPSPVPATASARWRQESLRPITYSSAPSSTVSRSKVTARGSPPMSSAVPPRKASLTDACSPWAASPWSACR